MPAANYDVVIIGGGAIGSAAAYFLASDPAFGGRIAVIERDATYKEASTVVATGVIRPQFSTPANIKMSLFGVEFLREAKARLSSAAHEADVGFHEHGYMILVAPDAAERFARSHKAQLDNGADVARLTPDEIAGRWPMISPAGLACGYYSATGAGSFDPWALLQAFRRKAIDLGVAYLEDEVVGLRQARGRVSSAELASGAQVSAGTWVNAAGARGAARIAAMVGAPLPVEPRKRTTFYVGCRDPLGDLPMVILPSGVWIRPEGKGFLCGLTPPEERDRATEDFTVDYDQFETEIWPLLAETIPAFESVKMISAYCGHYDFNTLDENAILGPLLEPANLFIATGFSGHGVMHSPAAGQVLADLIVRGRPGAIDASVFGYGRVLTATPVRELNVF